MLKIDEDQFVYLIWVLRRWRIGPGADRLPWGDLTYFGMAFQTSILEHVPLH
jgi:hypothetical protein